MARLELIDLRECAPQPFKELLDGTLGDRMYYEALQRSPGCHHIGCPFAWSEYISNTDCQEWDAWCEGFSSERAAFTAYERYSECGAHECRRYQVWKETGQ